MRDALKIIISRSLLAAPAALDCLRAVNANSPVVHLRYENVVRLAFSDSAAEFTQAERELIIGNMAGDADAGGLRMRAVRLSDSDWQLALDISGGNGAAGIRMALRAYAARP